MFVFVTTDKLKEFNEKVGPENQLNTAELDSLQTLMEGKDVTDVHISNISKVLDWPTGNSSFLYHTFTFDLLNWLCPMVTLSHGGHFVPWGDRAATVAFYLPLPCAMVFVSPQILPIFFLQVWFKCTFNWFVIGFPSFIYTCTIENVDI